MKMTSGVSVIQYFKNLIENQNPKSYTATEVQSPLTVPKTTQQDTSSTVIPYENSPTATFPLLIQVKTTPFPFSTTIIPPIIPSSNSYPSTSTKFYSVSNISTIPNTDNTFKQDSFCQWQLVNTEWSKCQSFESFNFVLLKRQVDLFYACDFNQLCVISFEPAGSCCVDNCL